MHRPILLKCGHAYGTPCLARWAHSSYFSNHCPLCRGQLYVEAETTVAQINSTSQVESMLEAIHRVQNSCSSHPLRTWCEEKEAFSEEQRRNLYDELKEYGSELATERTMVFLDAHIQDWRQTNRNKYRVLMLRPEEQQDRRLLSLRMSRS